ncbi:MAG TPA: DUF1365 domain-containing protein [Rudaea sp.]|nr:DUF1365 domain-containing protein [Rudaea sp.]
MHGREPRSTPESTLQSAIYEGWVRHRRHVPHAHAFRYRMCMLYLDLDEIDRIFAGRWLWSVDRRNVAEFRRSDYLGDPRVPLADAVRARVQAATGTAPEGPIRLLTHLRYFGHCFNPVSFYYCYAEDGVTLQTIVAEITNTPWKERHSYVLPVASAGQEPKGREGHGWPTAADTRHSGALAWTFRKAFHVSPFLPLERDYAWRFTVPADALRVHMDVRNGHRTEVDATLVLQRRALDATSLARVLLRFPAMTLRVVIAIHWQALRLWLRRNPVYDHPNKQGT